MICKRYLCALYHAKIKLASNNSHCAMCLCPYVVENLAMEFPLVALVCVLAKDPNKASLCFLRKNFCYAVGGPAQI